MPPAEQKQPAPVIVDQPPATEPKQEVVAKPIDSMVGGSDTVAIINSVAALIGAGASILSSSAKKKDPVRSEKAVPKQRAPIRLKKSDNTLIYIGVAAVVVLGGIVALSARE